MGPGPSVGAPENIDVVIVERKDQINGWDRAKVEMVRVRE